MQFLPFWLDVSEITLYGALSTAKRVGFQQLREPQGLFSLARLGESTPSSPIL